MSNWTKEQYAEYQNAKAGGKTQAPVSQPAAGHEPLAANDGEASYTGRISLRITSYRRRLLDRSNLYGGVKYLEDCCTIAGLIPGDTEREIDLQVRQVKISTREEEKTVIEITYPL